MMTTYIYLRQVRMHAYHGVLPQEGVVGGNYVINLKLGYDITIAMTSDDVADTLNYAEVYGVLKKYIVDGTEAKGQKCPSCGHESLVYQEGCLICKNCGASRCG